MLQALLFLISRSQFLLFSEPNTCHGIRCLDIRRYDTPTRIPILTSTSVDRHCAARVRATIYHFADGIVVPTTDGVRLDQMYTFCIIIIFWGIVSDSIAEFYAIGVGGGGGVGVGVVSIMKFTIDGDNASGSAYR